MCVCVFVFTVQLSTNYQQEPATPTTTTITSPEATTAAAITTTTTTTTSHLCVQQQQREIPRDFPPVLCVSATIQTNNPHPPKRQTNTEE